ncbi:hypothetical protein A4J85_002085 [Salmonella enterica subsp. enterica]|uniref:Uncharacterized protein n=1 Tax=Salmonella newport TaxID=108619 RepID=A0A5X8Y1R7_SALNE|nr:hypothetical protein [Salmonella enterica]EBE4280752.1 hypothetical protein [Salmonella enterica subsp. enterica]EBS4085707.1 hypothetical protein [Salmonella enterica subsp. enterica serovar Newport]EBS4306529.1 hypothetical protein [Salmonella enterica subsp. enterica serovar Duesseldorf]ECE5796253.1 hypothetical protein [Salmonella enterica subsp. diarizonae]EDB4569866.1 hypothetical protein [Salmonella enterica subsp. enterica serovar Panama]EDL3398762.1 hypothetical protein [Salmonell
MTTITKERIELFVKSPLENGLTRGEQMELARIALASLDADKPELKIAELINKFYERYPLASFNKDTDRAEALGYFLAGAELQCFGEFIKYEELFGDE